ncbi:Uncharacterised protein [Mycobacterium tuberculosis]|uniref:Uncharacterized protein n=1 Tax=Mycobacterium tuberculosis TaxID=1773 RepID=A0A655IMG2_MYCTX|nr:Uncharacterised protein [Mycobacterium tuberculosis]COW03781.1 Uncharacterised protein [Mycobacterium tuberculosis]CPA48738.1 Uncharacterised protein [Mycobacterium tuberculosis]CPC69700.1 Uncharacterised protein [Mycobacterium tuberculosis]
MIVEQSHAGVQQLVANTGLRGHPCHVLTKGVPFQYQ